MKPVKLDYSVLTKYDHVQSPAEKNEILAKGGTPEDFEMLDDDEDSDEDDHDSSEEKVIDFDLKATFCHDFCQVNQDHNMIPIALLQMQLELLVQQKLLIWLKSRIKKMMMKRLRK